MASVTDLDLLIDHLSNDQSKLLRQIFTVSVARGRIRPPGNMLPWIERQFGSVGPLLEQKVIKVANEVTGEGALFNPVRALRPRQFADLRSLEAKLNENAGSDPFDRPVEDTPEDMFGRVRGEFCVTAGNIAKYDAMHGIVIFDRHDPLEFSREEVCDYIETGWRWAQKAHEHDPEARYYFFLWNCLQRAGASIEHGHCQVVLARDRHYPKIEALRRAAIEYRKRYGSDYFEDLFAIHESLGLGFEKDGVRVMAYLSPVKEREVMVLSPGLSRSFKDRVYEVLACYRDVLKVASFDVGMAVPPFGNVAEDWSGFPVLLRLVDRGYPWDRSSDFGSMELYAASVVSSDPFKVAGALRKALLE